ncbi:MAG: PAS domain-containing protein [Deltaproteobacteria bacterium]|nr:PAS domain-containing protein [Deltaproteobacteria bacterium]
MKKNFFYKVFATFLVIIVVSLAVVGFLTTSLIKKWGMEQIERNLLRETKMITLVSSKADIPAKAQELAKLTSARVTLIDTDGTVLFDTRRDATSLENHLNRPEIQEARIRGSGTAIRYSRTLSIDSLYVAYPLQKEGALDGYVRLSRPLAEVADYTNAFTIIIIESFGIVGFLSFIIAFIFSSRLVSPIQEIQQFTERLRRGDSVGSILIHSGDEVGRLAQNINFMVSELNDSIQRANREKGKIEAAFASMNDGILILDRNDRIETMNDAFKRFFKVRFLRDVAGKTCLEAFRNSDLQAIFEDYRRRDCLRTIGEIQADHGGAMILTVNISPIKGLPPGDMKTMIVFHDTTQLKKLEEMRVDFVANVTHEIKTPLAAILGFVETLKDGAMEERDTAAQFLDTIERHARRLNRLVDDLLAISDIELGKTNFYFEDVPLESVIDGVLPLIERRMLEKNIAFEKNIPPDLPSIRADRDRLAQIFLNILDNAVKFTPSSEKVHLACLKRDDGTVACSITNSGVDIPKAALARLGERFYRVDKTRSRDLGGTGLGLSIVKHLMKAHGGTLRFESSPGKGTTVILDFPAIPPQACAT